MKQSEPKSEVDPAGQLMSSKLKTDEIKPIKSKIEPSENFFCFWRPSVCDYSCFLRRLKTKKKVLVKLLKKRSCCKSKGGKRCC